MVLSFLVAEWLHLSAHPVLAPLTALLVVQLTTYKTVAHGLGRIASVLVGVLVALAVANVIGLTWWSLGLVVALSLIVGRLLRLGPHLFEVPISAMLVLEVGGASELVAGRVYETLVGAAIGIGVSALIAPPLYMQPAGDAIGELAERLARFSREFAVGLRGPWSRAAADHWLNEARALDSEVGHADRTLAHAEESARLNVRGRPAREMQPRLRTALTGLERAYVTLRSLSRALLDRTYFVPEPEQGLAYHWVAREALADVLDTAAAAFESVVPVVAGAQPAQAGRATVQAHLADLRRRRDRLKDLLLVDPLADEAAWQQHGALLAAIDRLRTEVEAAVRESDSVWRPPSLGTGSRPLTARFGLRRRGASAGMGLAPEAARPSGS